MNKRYLLASESLWFREIIRSIKEVEKQMGIKVKTKIINEFLLRIVKIFNPEINHLMPFIAQELHIDGSLAKKEMNLNYLGIATSI